MAGRLMKAVHLARDVVVALLSVVIIGSQYQKLSEEPVFLVTVSISAVMLLLSVIDATLIVARLRWKWYFLGNAVVQLILGLLWLALFAPIGAIVVVLNILALLTLREKKTAEERAAHPPLPRTRNYKVVEGVGTLIMVASLFLTWFTSSGSSISLLGVYSALATHSSLAGFTVSQTGAASALLALAGSPVVIVSGALGLRWRRLSVVAGVLSVLAGAGAAVALVGVVGVGPYVLVAGGALVLVGFFAFRRA
ncbi:MAG TPA: hypothetical protein VKF15_08030 [Nitrososphaerales archaeon]|nr:hypothetical protein [Nitrososphaerales archaeon]